MRFDYASMAGRQILIVALFGLTLSGCSNSKLRRTPEAEAKTPWFCEMNEARDDWDCIQDSELARNPQPARLPGDEPEPNLDSVAIPTAETTTARDDPLREVEQTPQASAPATVNESRPSNTATADLLTLPGDLFVVQLIAVANARLADEFIASRAIDAAMSLQLARDGELYHVVLLEGVYDSYGEAQAAAEARPDSLTDIEPWIRTLDSIQSAWREADSLIAVTE